MPASQTIYSPAKINVCLYVLQRRIDNYHELLSLMIPLGLSDIIDIQPTDNKISPTIILTLNKEKSTVPVDTFPLDNTNLICKAYQAFYKACPQLPALDITVHITKHIPLQAGLGGGSSNAASILNYLNAAHNLPLSKTEIITIARSLGADVPFFITAVPALAEGIGEKLTAIKLDPGTTCRELLLIKPATVSQPTGALFNALDRPQNYNHPCESKINLLKQNTAMPFCKLEQYQHNDFENIIRTKEPILDRLFNLLTDCGLEPGLSGTGPTVFVILPPTLTPQQTQIIAGLENDPGYWFQHTTFKP